MRTIYGIDVSKTHLDIYGLTPNGKVIKKRIKNNLKAIEAFLLSLEKEAIICAEFTGVYSDLLAFTCHQLSINISLINGYTLRHSMGNEKGKSDAIDAVRIWEYGNRFTDKLIFFEPDNELIQELKELYNIRNQLVKQRRMMLTSQASRQQATANSMVVQRTVQQAVEQITEHIRALEQEMVELIASSHLNTNMELVTSIKGVGKITAIELIIASGNFKKLPTCKKAASYAGVCPFPNQSGNKAYKSRVHPRSDRKLKSTLYMAAVSVCRTNKEFRIYKDRKLGEGKHYFLVMNNVINKLLRMIYAIVSTGKPFDFEYLPQDQRPVKLT